MDSIRVRDAVQMKYQTFLENTWEGEPAFYLQSIARTKSYTYYLYILYYTVNI